MCNIDVDLKIESCNVSEPGKGSSIAFLAALKQACCRGKSYSPVSQGKDLSLPVFAILVLVSLIKKL